MHYSIFVDPGVHPGGSRVLHSCFNALLRGKNRRVHHGNQIPLSKLHRFFLIRESQISRSASWPEKSGFSLARVGLTLGINVGFLRV